MIDIVMSLLFRILPLIIIITVTQTQNDRFSERVCECFPKRVRRKTGQIRRDIIATRGDIIQARDSESSLTDIDDPDALVLEEFERDGHVLQFLRAEGGPLVVLRQPLLREHLDQAHQPEAVGQIAFQVTDVLVHGLQPLVRPSREGVLLDPLPLRVLGQLALEHLVLLLLLGGLLALN